MHLTKQAEICASVYVCVSVTRKNARYPCWKKLHHCTSQQGGGWAQASTHVIWSETSTTGTQMS